MWQFIKKILYKPAETTCITMMEEFKRRIQDLEQQLQECLRREHANAKKRERSQLQQTISTDDEDVEYLDSEDDDVGAVHSNNILNRKRVRVRRKQNDMVDESLQREAEREAVTVVMEVLENELAAFQAQEVVLKGTDDSAIAQEQLSEYTRLNDAGLRSRIYGFVCVFNSFCYLLSLFFLSFCFC